MSDINRIVMVGRLTRDPELKTTSAGRFYCRFTLASNRSYTKRDSGETIEEVGFFDCTAWGKLAEIMSKHLSKGRRIGIDGFLQFNKWEDSEGKTQSRVNIVVDNFQFLEPKPAAGGYAPSSQDMPSEMSGSSPNIGNDAFGADDVPF